MGVFAYLSLETVILKLIGLCFGAVAILDLEP